ncbi:MAG: GGDEF domain-containing protein [Proteocatella sp.]
MQKKYLEQDDIIFEKLFELSGQAIAVVSSSGDLIYQNKYAVQIFGDQLKSYISNNQIKFHEVEKNIYIVNLLNHTHYIKYKSEKSTFKGYDSNIFIFEDVSLEYLQTHRLEQMALLDALTKLPNRYALEQDFNMLVSDETNKYIFGILDIDHFKSVNDTYGHNIGDEVLKLLSEVFKNRLRHEDKIYRYGGEEFVILINNISLTNAKKLLEDINLIFSDISEEKYGFKKTYSCGLIELTIDENASLQYYIQNADILLYKAKENGRNRIEIKT